MDSELYNAFDIVFRGGMTDTEVRAYLRAYAKKFFPLPSGQAVGEEWWHHVPVNLLLAWGELSDDARVAIAVMGQSFTSWNLAKKELAAGGKGG